MCPGGAYFSKRATLITSFGLYFGSVVNTSGLASKIRVVCMLKSCVVEIVGQTPKQGEIMAMVIERTNVLECTAVGTTGNNCRVRSSRLWC